RSVRSRRCTGQGSPLPGLASGAGQVAAAVSRLQADVFGLVQPEASSPPFAARTQANLPPISCTRINKLLVHLSAGNPKKCLQQSGLGFPAGCTSAGGIKPLRQGFPCHSSLHRIKPASCRPLPPLALPKRRPPRGFSAGLPQFSWPGPFGASAFQP